jgi:hypothetical protein
MAFSPKKCNETAQPIHRGPFLLFMPPATLNRRIQNFYIDLKTICAKGANNHLLEFGYDPRKL